jgi:hypothetical protein
VKRDRNKITSETAKKEENEKVKRDKNEITNEIKKEENE